MAVKRSLTRTAWPAAGPIKPRTKSEPLGSLLGLLKRAIKKPGGPGDVYVYVLYVCVYVYVYVYVENCKNKPPN